MARDANPKHPWLYVGAFSKSTIYIYDLARGNFPLIGTITQGVDEPDALTVDTDGTLYVANQTGNDVTIYPPGAITSSLALTQSLVGPTSAAVDAAGDVYVTNRGASPPSIVIFPPGQTAPSATITSSLITDPIQGAFDAAGNYYFSDFNVSVSMIAAGSQQPVSLGLGDAAKAEGLALGAHATLFVNVAASGGQAYITRVYSLSDGRERRPLKGEQPANTLATGTIGHEKFVFVPDYNSDTVTFYRQDSTEPSVVLTTAAHGPDGIAYKPPGVL